MKKFDIPIYYRSPIISRVKESRKVTDPRKKDYSPSILDFGSVKFLIARHFGFCYGVENAIEIAYKTIEQNSSTQEVSEDNGKRIFLLSEMIHNPEVNEDLRKKGVRFIREHTGKQLIDWDELRSDDIVIVPAFGTTVEIQQLLKERGIDPYRYDTTCPFVEKVWNRAEYLGGKGYTIIVHGKYNHEETIATFSHSAKDSPTLIVRDLNETKKLCNFILGKLPIQEFASAFKSRYSKGFDPSKDLQRVGVVNQTTMLASETRAIADLIKQTMQKKYGNIEEHFADTSDTLCYATYDNQKATYGLIEAEADFAIVVGGYNSSNTSHIVELCEKKFPVYFISGADKIVSAVEISHYNIHSHKDTVTQNWLNCHSERSEESHPPIKIILTSGASCPDAILDEVLNKILTYFPDAKPIEEVFESYLLQE